MNRRKTLGIALLALLVATAGCVDLVLGNTPTFESSEANVSETALDGSGYELSSSDTQVISRNVSVAGQERTVRVINHVTQYNRTLSLGPFGDRELGRVIVFTTPQIEMAGQALNPATDWSERRVVTEVAQRYAGIDDVSRDSNRTVPILGAEREVVKFSGTTTVGGDDVGVYVHVTKFTHEGDVVVGIAVHPQQLPDEEDRQDVLLSGIQH
ncbi:DUF6517 family protein [Halobacteria archaeon HArc-gm2]|nr:DUF6517 family protein [Halobacteria archaeon HArc-gm2]